MGELCSKGPCGLLKDVLGDAMERQLEGAKNMNPNHSFTTFATLQSLTGCRPTQMHPSGTPRQRWCCCTQQTTMWGPRTARRRGHPGCTCNAQTQVKHRGAWVPGERRGGEKSVVSRVCHSGRKVCVCGGGGARGGMANQTPHTASTTHTTQIPHTSPCANQPKLRHGARGNRTQAAHGWSWWWPGTGVTPVTPTRTGCTQRTAPPEPREWPPL